MKKKPSQVTKSIGQLLRTAREKKGLVIVDVCKALKWQVRKVSEIETGSQYITVDDFVAYCDFLKLNPVEVLDAVIE